MKKILAILAIAASVAVNAQAQSKEVAAAKTAVEKAQAAVENAKQNTKTATWLKYGEALVKAYNAPAGNAWVGMTAQELQVLAANERPTAESQVELGGQMMTKREYANKNLYFDQAGQLRVIEITKPVVENALDKAVEAYAKAAELDAKGQKTKDIVAALQSINEKYTEEAYNAYTLGDLAKSSVLFEKAVKAAGTAPLSQLDTNSLYNAGLTAWNASNFERAKGFFQQCLDNKYYGGNGETYAKLADIADRLGDKEASKNYLTEGSQKFPESQSLLIGLINYYINSGEDTAALFNLFAEAQKNEPENASLFYVEGNARKKLGQNEEALAAYEKACQVNPNYEWGFIGKGIQLYDMAAEVGAKADEEYDNNKYLQLMGEFEKYLKSCIEPFEKAFEMVSDPAIKESLATYIKNACFRFRTDPEYKAKYDVYNAFTSGE